MLTLLLATAAVTPTPTPEAASQGVTPLYALAQLLIIVVSMGLWAVGSAGLAYIYAYLVKQVLRAQIGVEAYRKALQPALWLITLVAGIVGYHFGGPVMAVATGLGAASTPLLHDVIDGMRGWKRMALAWEKDLEKENR
jgi:hypothetical protein